MKKLLLSIAGWCCAGISFAQLPASTNPENRKAVLEELTGIYCYWCPAGHKIASNLKASRPPGSVVLINCHCTGFSSPYFNDPDYKTPEGDTIAEMPGMAVPGVPAGAINRHQWPGQVSIPVSRNLWAGYVDQMLAKPSYVNVALEGTLNVDSRVLTVQVQAYYTGNSPVSTNKLTVVLLEDTVIGKQAGGFDNYPEQTNPDGSYRHHHMLRKMLTSPATGEIITTTTFGSIVNRTYTYHVPTKFKNTLTAMGNLKLACFIAEGNTEIITGAYGPLILTGFPHQRDAAITALASEEEVCAGKLHPRISIYNNGSAVITSAALSYKVNNGPATTYNYTGYIAPATSKTFELPQISFSPAALNTLSATITGVNGNSDQDNSNNALSQDSIKITPHTTNDTNMRIEYTQIDLYNGSYWKLYDETTNTLVAEDGPFPDVPYMATVVRIKNFKVRPNTCYKLVRANSKFLSDYNATLGNFTLYSGSTPFIVAPSADTGRAFTWFKTGPHTLGIDNKETIISELTVSPNPAYDQAQLRFHLQNARPVTITVYDAIGSRVYALSGQRLPAGVQSISLPVHQFASGLYTVRIHTADGAVSARFSIGR